MKQNLPAVFKNGVFMPSAPPALADGQRVRLTVEVSDGAPTDDPLALASRVYEGLSPDAIRQVEAIALDRRNFFGGAP